MTVALANEVFHMSDEPRRLKVYNQKDQRWRNKIYSSHGDQHQTMASSGLAPTLCASIVAALRDDTVDPWTLAQLSMVWGCRTYASGTSYSFFKDVAEHYSFRRFVQSRDFRHLKTCLKAGGYAICHVKNVTPLDYWHDLGDYILVHSYHNGTVYAYGYRGRTQKQVANRFISDLKMCFCYYPG